MKYMIIISFIICFLSTNKVYSQESWIVAAKSIDSKGTYYINSTYISNENQIIKIWIKSIIQKDLWVTKGKSKIKKKVYTENRLLYEFDCENHKTMLLYDVKYNSSGDVISAYNPEEYEKKWEISIPDTIGEILLNKVCELYNL